MRDLAPVLRIYQDLPLANGSMAVFTDVDVAVEIPGGADEWGLQALSCSTATTRCGLASGRSCTPPALSCSR